MVPRVFSFAVFDTCLARIHAHPLDQLFALAARVLPAPPGAPGREDRHEFVHLRLRAEEEARSGPGLEAPSLGMVYERFPAANPWSLDPQALFATELEMTVAQARPVPLMLGRVRGHARRGERVVYLSDSLLPGPTLRRLLELHGFAGEVFTAGDLGKRKDTGSLYLHMLAAESVEARQALHTGADPVRDVRVPRRLGMQTVLFPQARFTPHEEHLLSRLRASTPDSSRVVAASRLARLGLGEDSALGGPPLSGKQPGQGDVGLGRGDDSERQPSEDVPVQPVRDAAHDRALPHTGHHPSWTGPDLDQIKSFAAGVAAPVLTAFVCWAMDEAQARGADRLYFLAREGQILHRLAGEIRKARGGPEPRYLMGSLAAWTAPLMSGLTRSDLDWLAAEGRSRRPQDLLTRMGLSADELLSASGRSMPELLSDQPLDPEGLEELWSVLVTPGARGLIKERSRSSRGLLLDYLRQEGALDSPLLAVADMGWTLFTQRALKLALSESPTVVEGWYFGLSGSRLGRMEAGAHRALFLERAGQARTASLEDVLFRNVRLMELTFAAATHGRVLGYERRGGQVVPMLGPTPPGVGVTRVIQRTVLDFARVYLGGGFDQEAREALLETAREALRRFLVEPGHHMVSALSALEGMADGPRPVLRRLTLRDAAKAWLWSLGLRLPPSRPPSWLEGSAALSRGWLRPYLRGPRLMRLLRNCFP